MSRVDVWKTVTDEDLGSWWIWDTPSDLVESIIKANGGENNGVYDPNNKTSSSAE